MDKQLAVGADEWRCDGDAGDGDGIDAAVRALGSSPRVYRREERGDVRSVGRYGYSLDYTGQKHGSRRERDKG